MVTILAFIFTLGLLVTIHEYGHFIVARMFDVKIIRFAIGFGKPLWKTTFGKDNTEFVVAAIPLGGYVKMLDEAELRQDALDATERPVHYSEKELNRAFNRLPVLKRMAIVLAGPFANLLLAVLLYWCLFLLGVVGLKPIVGDVEKASAVATAGFELGDLIRRVNGQKVASWQDVRWTMLNEVADGKSVDVEVLTKQNALKHYRLALNSINQEDTETDMLEQLGFRQFQPVVKPIIGKLSPDGAAIRAGLVEGDLIKSLDGKEIEDWSEFVELVRNHPGKTLNLSVSRAGMSLSVPITPEATQERGGVVGKVGAGVYFDQAVMDQYFITSQYGILQSLQKAIDKTYQTSVLSLKMMGKMLVGDVSWKMVSGPVTIANYAGQSAEMGVKVFIGFLALISISIGILNLLPIPVLDGGHFMYYVIEIITGKPVSETFMLWGQKVGMMFIAGMMILAFFNDINRLITG